jgi:hypothetical protein
VQLICGMDILFSLKLCCIDFRVLTCEPALLYIFPQELGGGHTQNCPVLIQNNPFTHPKEMFKSDAQKVSRARLPELGFIAALPGIIIFADYWSGGLSKLLAAVCWIQLAAARLDDDRPALITDA